MVLIAGLSAESTLNAPAKCFANRGHRPSEVLILPNGARPQSLVTSARQSVTELKQQ
jgi:hypothetical protein